MPERQVDEIESAGFTPTAAPSEFLTLLEANTGGEPAVGVALAGTRTLPPLIIAEPSFSLPEPPPGKPDIPPPLVIGGRLEPAELIKQTIPVYPAKLNGELTPCPVTIQVRFILQYPQGPLGTLISR